MQIREFPIHSQIGVFNDEADIDRWMLSDRFHPIDYFTFIKHLPYINTSFTNECLRRFNFLKNYNTYSFSDKMEELPNWWCEMLELMETETQKAAKALPKDVNK